MGKGTLYNKMDCLDVLETLKDKTFSLIYLDFNPAIGKRSKRITYDESRNDPIAALRKEKGGTLDKLSADEIKTFIEECENDRKREYEKYLFKIVQNCFRVLRDNGIIVYRETEGSSDYVDIKYVLENLFSMFGKRVLEHVGMNRCFDLIYFYSKNSGFRFPEMYELQPLERYPYEDEKGRYRLLSLESRPNETNLFKWKGYFPREGKGWKYNKKMLNDLSKKGYIAQIENEDGKDFPWLKYYREEHPVLAPKIWTDRVFFERLFDTFTSKNDKVLGIYENLGFACSAEKKHRTWCSVYPREAIKSFSVIEGKMVETQGDSFRGKGLLEGNYNLVEVLENNVPRTYNENFPLTVKHIKEKKQYFQNERKEYEINERLPINVGNKTDEILYHFIKEYMRREDISLSEFEKRTGVSRQTFYEMESVIDGKIKPKRRKKQTILKIAVYTGMMYQEVKKALESAGLAFGEDVADDTIISWLFSEKRDTDELNELIQEKCEKANWIQEEIDKRLFLTKCEEEKRKKTTLDR